MRKYAVGLYSVRDELAKDLWGTLRKVKSMGYDGVEFFGEFSHTAQEIKAVLRDTGLSCVGWHTPWHYVSQGNIMGTISYNKLVGNNEIVIPGLPQEMTNSKKAWLDTAKAFSEAAGKLADYGMGLSYHNHASEFQNMEGGLPYHFLFDNTCGRVGMQLDNGNAYSAGADTDIYNPLIKYPNRARTLHHKPYSTKTGFATMIGEDSIDWAKYFKLCDEHQKCLEWHIIEYEDEKYSQLDGIDECLKAIRKLGF